jgi:menaquinone-dependent protoporphyrinogen IX oxidase
MRVFISYAWENDEYRTLVKRLAARLREDGIDVRLDAWHLEGLSIPEFMSREVRHADKILVVCSPQYRQKATSWRMASASPAPAGSQC